MTPTKTTRYLTALAALTLAPAASLAQVPADSVLELSEVSVTALKHTPRLAAQPIASTTIGATEVERFNIVTMKQVSELSPNLYIPDYGSRMTSSIYMRGIGARIDQPAVGLNVDNVPLLNKDNYDFDLMDIERVEVLRGPQSALYGRNTMAGLINIYTLSPMRYQGVRAIGEVSSGESAKIGASVYRLLSDALGMSISAYYTRTNGYYHNTYNDSDVGRERQGSARWRLVWHPSAALTLDNVAAITLSRQSGYPYESLATGLINYNDTCFYKRTGVTDGLTVNWRRGSLSLSGITSLQYINDNMTLDQDFLPDPYFTLTQRRHEWAVTQDLIARGNCGRYRWMGGAFGFYKRQNMSAPVTFGPSGITSLIIDHYNQENPYYPIGWDDDHFLLGSDFTTPTWGLAAYHESTLELDRLTLAAGLRLDYDLTTLRYHSSCGASYTIYDATGDDPTFFSQVPVIIDDRDQLHKSSLQALPKFTATYRYGSAPDDNVYLSIAKGYKPGGYNTQMFSDVLQQRVMETMGVAMLYNVDQIISYKPEQSWNYEIGWHSTLLDGALRASASTFYIDCRDQQLTMFPPGTITGRIMTNAGRTRSLGAEISATYTPTPRWAVNLSYGYTSARFVEFDNGKTDFAHKRVPYAPAHTMFGGVTYTQPVGLRWLDRISLTVDARGIGDIYWDEDNTSRQPLYGLLDSTLRFELRDCSLELWGNNLTDTSYRTFQFLSMGNKFAQRGKPRSIGATLRLNFKTK